MCNMEDGADWDWSLTVCLPCAVRRAPQGGEAMSVSAQAYFPAFKEKQRVAMVRGMSAHKETKDVTDLFYTFLKVSAVMAVFLVSSPCPLLLLCFGPHSLPRAAFRTL